MKWRVVAAAVALTLVAGCAGSPLAPGSTAAEPALRVVASSELADLGPVLDEVAAATGVRVMLSAVDTLHGTDWFASAPFEQSIDALWFSSNRYLAMRPEVQARLGPAIDIMSSPVVLGLPRSVAQRLGWVGRPVSWAEIAAAAGARRFSYGMADPSVSDSAFSTIVAVATALADTGSALTEDQARATTPALRDFYAAQTLVADSSGLLQEAYVRRVTGADSGEPVDGLLTYESLLLGLNASGRLPEPLELVHPADGLITADYPFTLLAGASEHAKDMYRRVTEYLRTPDVQRAIAERTFRRPAVPGVAGVQNSASTVELPFPAERPVIEALSASYFDRRHRPSRTIYLLDTAGSMAEHEQSWGLKQVVWTLAGARGDWLLSERLRRFRIREEVTLLPFDGNSAPPQTIRVPEDDPSPDRQRVVAAVKALPLGGDDAIYDSLRTAYRLAGQQIAADPDRFTSIVLVTDGENTTGTGISQFREFVASLPPDLRGVPVFCVLFGEVNSEEMTEVARLTGGRTFAIPGSVSWAEVFQEIRGYV